MSNLNRREFIAATGTLVVGFAVMSNRVAAQAAPAAPAVSGFIRINANGTVTVFTGRVELGTGVATAMRQMVAEELEIPFEAIEWVQGDTARVPNQGGTFGSTTVAARGTQLRQAAATAREALLQMAAEKWGVAKDQLMAEAGQIRSKSNANQKASYAEVLGDKNLSLGVDTRVTLKPDAELKVIGKSVKRPDIAEKIFATFSYVHDIRVPGMLHARVIRPSPGAATEVVAVDESSIAGIPGAKVVRIGNFVAVVAETEWNAVKASRALQVTWAKPAGLPSMDKMFEALKNVPTTERPLVNEAGAADAVAKAAKVIEADYYWPFQNHASIGPSCAVADVQADSATVWSGTQSPFGLQGEIARLIGLAANKVRVIYADASGCYGRLFQDDAAADAALISKAVGKPVRVLWNRADEHGWAFKGPAMHAKIKAGFDAQGNVVGYVYDVWSPSHVGTSILGNQLNGWSTPNFFGDDTADWYNFPQRRIMVNALQRSYLRYGNLRTLGAMQSGFFADAFVDEMAAAAGADALAFRLKYVKEPRMGAVLEAAAKQAKWVSRPSFSQPQSGTVKRGRGIALGEYGNTWVAAVAEVQVDTTTGKITVEKVVLSHDCGLVVNPDGVTNQVEGNVIQATSRTLMEEVKFDATGVTNLDWSSYPIITFPEVPVVETVLVRWPGAPMSGAGEPASVPVPAAIANAVFDAIGVRLRNAPFTADKVLAALKQA